jgi:hypothetical protein
MSLDGDLQEKLVERWRGAVAASRICEAHQ